MKRISLAALLLVFLASCANTSGEKVRSRWQDIRETNACMPGGRMWSEHEAVKDKYREMYSSILRFKKISGEKTVPFLIGRLGSREATSVRICPFENAIEGELAIYILAEVTGKQWFEAFGLKSRPDNGQDELRRDLLDHRRRQQLVDFYSPRVPNQRMQPTNR